MGLSYNAPSLGLMGSHHSFSLVGFAVVGKDLEAEREMEGNMEWKDRVEKWKVKQEKRGMMNKDGEEDNEQDNYEDEML